jgi:O-antigen ligase
MKAPAHGLLQWAFPAMLLVGAVSVLTSGRDLTHSFSDLQALDQPLRLPAVVWLQRAVSLLLLVAALEQVINHLALQRRVPSFALLTAFLIFWAGTIGAPALFGAHPRVSHELLYALAMGTACCLVQPEGSDRILRAARDALMALMLAGLALWPLRPTLVMDPTYTAGLLQALPRFAGLTPHPVTQGSMAQVATLLLWAFPYPRPWVNRAAWSVALGVLVVAQSKTAWIAFVVCLGAMAIVRYGPALWRRLGDPRHGVLGLLVLGVVASGIAAVAVALIVGDATGRMGQFLQSPEGAQLATMTGRDRIWAIAAEEWRSHPVFGYGLTLWDALYRARIDLPHATHAHNQLMDDAARTGTVGVLALGVYALTLAVLSVRHARATAGLSIALFLSLALRAISEVPLSLLGYGSELMVHLVLLVALASAAARQPLPAHRARTLRYGVVP